VDLEDDVDDDKNLFTFFYVNFWYCTFTFSNWQISLPNHQNDSGFDAFTIRLSGLFIFDIWK